jgi:hypothetical protein
VNTSWCQGVMLGNRPFMPNMRDTVTDQAVRSMEVGEGSGHNRTRLRA